jgi:hypothetical protein
VSARLTLPDGVTTVCGGRNVVVTAVETPPPPPPPPPEMLPIPGKVMFMLIMGTGTIHQKKREKTKQEKKSQDQGCLLQLFVLFGQQKFFISDITIPFIIKMAESKKIPSSFYFQPH